MADQVDQGALLRLVVGMVIAFVGSEATGKSTILNEIETWLSQNHKVRRIHSGKPSSTLLTFVPHFLLPALRKLFPEQRSLRVGERYEETRDMTERVYPLLFGLRSVMLAYERRTLIRRALSWSADGTIVLSDRYPSHGSRAPDGPQLSQLPAGSSRGSLRRWLAALEAHLYHDIPLPNVVIHLTAPLEVTLARNATRDKTEPEDYVRFRHSLSSNIQFDGAVVHHIDTDRPLEAVVREVKEAIGDAL
jgi:thymidylate kinase